MSEWFEKFFDGPYAAVLPYVFDQAQTLEHVRVVKRLLKLRKNARVLDIPCGMGRLTIPMAASGLAMTGVDLIPSYIRRARLLAKKEGGKIRFFQSDMREIAFDREFDAAFNWFGSFGYFSDADNSAFCKRIFRALKPGGRFLVEGINKSWLLAHFLGQFAQVVGDVRVVYYNRYEPRTSRILSTWTFSKDKEIERRRVILRIFNGAEMRAVLRAAGFCDIRLFGFPPPGRLTRHSQRLIAVGTRPKESRSKTLMPPVK